MIRSRVTQQNVRIKEYLQKVRTHPTAETIYWEVKKRLPKITLGTVYRNLNKMVEKGEIKRMEIHKEFRYDGVVSDHQHGVCHSCGKILDFFQQKISEDALKALRSPDFKQDGVHIVFGGMCAGCSTAIG